MKITEVEHGLDLAQGAPGYVRSPGLHLSALYGSLYSELEPKRFPKDGEPDPVRMEVGLAFEETLEAAIGQRLFGARPGELATQHDDRCEHAAVVVEIGDAICHCGAGVAYSPDFIFYNGVTRGGEFKATWMSCKKGIRDPKFSKWMTQMKSYGHHLRMTQWLLFVLFVNGDYSFRPPYGGPHMRCWEFEFTKQEMADEWSALVRHGRRVGLLPEAA